MKKETIEQAANTIYPNDGFKDELYTDIGEVFREKFIEGAKEQAERMYSEEDLRRAFSVGVQIGADYGEDGENSIYDDFNKWFEQFKKK